MAEFTEREVPVSDLPPKALKHALSMGIDPADYLWIEQTALGRVNEDAVSWLVAESVWRNEQLKAWVAAERNWKAANAKVV
ncbi:hypothetical protein [Mycolicibacterium conceptionense]|uniref:hypothetical protein n=1 Tax=Mycolicibacterium conceptionense TaxID=451644 RepID=UPI001055F42A|nr:hypothetical protein [Mycolicibacterium conceptionense]